MICPPAVLEQHLRALTEAAQRPLEHQRVDARAEREPKAPLRAEDAAAVRRDWDEVVTEVSGTLVFRD